MDSVNQMLDSIVQFIRSAPVTSGGLKTFLKQSFIIKELTVEK